jgi:hypothetical protein
LYTKIVPYAGGNVKLIPLNYFNFPDFSRVVRVVIAVTVNGNSTTITIRGRLILCIIVVNRIPTITATIAINAIGYAVEVNAVILCNAVSIGGIICLNKLFCLNLK